MSLPASCVILAIEVYLKSVGKGTEGLELKYHTRSGLGPILHLKRHTRNLATFPCAKEDSTIILKHFKERMKASGHANASYQEIRKGLNS